MARYKIKQMDNRVATAGMHLGGNRSLRRKLEPGEVVEIPDDSPLGKAIYGTGKVEITLEPITRPLDYATAEEAKLCSPTYKPRGKDDEQKSADTVAKVQARLDAESAPKAEPVEEAPAPSRRGRRAQAANYGAEVSS